MNQLTAQDIPQYGASGGDLVDIEARVLGGDLLVHLFKEGQALGLLSAGQIAKFWHRARRREGHVGVAEVGETAALIDADEAGEVVQGEDVWYIMVSAVMA